MVGLLLEIPVVDPEIPVWNVTSCAQEYTALGSYSIVKANPP